MKRQFSVRPQSAIFIASVIAAVCVCTGLVTLINGCTEQGGVNPELPDETEEMAQTDDSPESSEPKYLSFDGWYFKKPMKLDEKSALRFAEKINWLRETYLNESNRVFWSVIPDKNYYLSALTDQAASFDYAGLGELLKQNVTGGEYIDLYGALELESFYRTDIHWRQEKLDGVLSALGEAMDFEITDEFSENYYENYIGMYDEKPDGSPLTDEDSETLVYLTSLPIYASDVDNFEDKESRAVYNLELLTGDVPYDVFLSGPTPIITIDSPDSETEERLVIFRDSFGSSLAPLLLGHYRQITLVDIRYIMSNLLSDYVDFTGADVLFMYNVEVINRSIMLK